MPDSAPDGDAGARRLVRAGVVAVCCLLLPLATARAQQDAVLQGRVVDAATGRAVAGATLELAGADTVRAESDADGRYRLPASGAGSYVLRIRAIGYAMRSVRVAPGAAPGAAAGEPLAVALTPRALALDELVVTAARRPQRLADVAVTTEVVSRAEIEQSGASDVAAVLVERAGVQYQEGHPSGAGVMLQGLGSERVLVLVDGQPVVGRIAGNFDLSRIPAAIVERVEIVKGPQSTLYGSEAMGGVINVITREAADGRWEGTAGFVAGTEGRIDGTVGGAVARGPVSATLDLGRRRVERTPGRSEAFGALADRTDAAGKVRWVADSTLEVYASGLYLTERQRWAAGSQFDFADNEQLNARVGAIWEVGGSHRLAPTVYLSRFDHLQRRSDFASPIAGTGDRQVQRMAEAELLYAGRVLGQALDGGLEVRHEAITSTDGRIPGGRRTLSTVEPFAQMELGGSRWSIVPGARLSWNEAWGTNLTPRVAARVRATDALTLRASAGRGFRAPDFKELYLEFLNDAARYIVHGNADLRPEHSDNLTVGAEWSRGRAYTRAQLFWNELHDFIETRPLASADDLTHYRYANVARSSTRGVDLEAGLTFGALRAEAGYSRLVTRDDATGEPLLGRPAHAAHGTLGYGLPVGLRASLTGVYTGRTPMQRDDATGAITSHRDAFVRFDLRAAQALPFDLELALGVDNLLDARPANWAGDVGRQLYAGLTWNVSTPNR